MMNKKTNKFEFKDEEAKRKYINLIISYFLDERGEEIGYIAAEKMLDFFLENIGEEVYKKAIGECKNLIRERIADLDLELEILSAKS